MNTKRINIYLVLIAYILFGIETMYYKGLSLLPIAIFVMYMFLILKYYYQNRTRNHELKLDHSQLRKLKLEDEVRLLFDFIYILVINGIYSITDYSLIIKIILILVYFIIEFNITLFFKSNIIKYKNQEAKTYVSNTTKEKIIKIYFIVFASSLVALALSIILYYYYIYN